MEINVHPVRRQSPVSGSAPAAPAPSAESTVPRDRVTLDGATSGRRQTPSPGRPAATLLQQMRPFIRDVHVVKAGAPPILGGHGAGVAASIPDSLRGFPSRRWVCTPAIEASHREYYGALTNAQLRAEDGNELEPLAMPLLQRRYGDGAGRTVVELGPATSTVVPRALPRAEHYFATDLSVALMERQRSLLHETGYEMAAALQVRGDTYDLPYHDGVADVLFTSCHPPFVSASPAERLQAFSEVARVLKPGGEFVVFPFERDKQHPEVAAFLERTFEPVDKAVSGLRGDREMVVLRKRG